MEKRSSLRIPGTEQLQSSPKHGSYDNLSSSGSGGNHITGSPGSPSCTSGNAQILGIDALLHHLEELKNNQGQLEDSFKNLKAYKQNYTVVRAALEEEQYRCDCVEQQLSDFTELHQNEIANLKEELASIDEKITYQSYEETENIHEALQALQTQLSKMEQQQVVQLQGLENTAARNQGLLKLIHFLIAVIVVLLLIVSTVASSFVPLAFSTLLFVFFTFLWRKWNATSEYVHNFWS